MNGVPFSKAQNAPAIGLERNILFRPKSSHTSVIPFFHLLRQAKVFFHNVYSKLKKIYFTKKENIFSSLKEKKEKKKIEIYFFNS